MQNQNPFEQILNKLDQIERTLIISVNAPKAKPVEPSDPNRIINLPEAAKLLRKPVGTVRSYIHSRNLPATLVGKGYLIKYRDLIEWFENLEVEKDNTSTGTATEKMQANRNRYGKD